MLEKPLYKGPIFVKKSPIHGYGVFAAEDIPKDEIVEECYTLLTPDGAAFPNHYFAGDEEHSALPLGYGCIYNHSLEPNISYRYEPTTRLVVFKAKRNIRRGEELCSSYGQDWFDTRNLSPKPFRGWRAAYQLLKGPILRAAFIWAALWGLIRVIAYLGLNRFLAF